MAGFSKLIVVITLVTALLGVPFGTAASAAKPANAVSVMAVYSDDNVLLNKAVELDNETKTALDALLKAANGAVGTSDTSYGKQIDTIANSERQDEHFWAFYVNGKMSAVGAGTYELQPGDKLTFHYINWNEQASGTYDPPVDHFILLKSLSKEEVREAADKAVSFAIQDGVSEWETVALKQAWDKTPDSALKNLKKIVKDKKGKFEKITDTERYVIAIVAAGGNPEDFEGYNLVQSIYNGDAAKQGLNGAAYALLALDSGSFKVPKDAVWTREKLVSFLLEKQNQDGGWNWDGTKASDPDTTAMILASLAPYKQDKSVASSIEKGTIYLKAQYINSAINNSSTAAQIVIALSALGIDAGGEEFTNKYGSLVSYLASYQNDDGGFYYQGAPVKSDAFSTEQGLLGLVAYNLYNDGKGSLYKLQVNKTASAAKVAAEKKSEEDYTRAMAVLGMAIVLIGVAGLVYSRVRRNEA